MVEKNFSNFEYFIEDLSRDMCMSCVIFYCKIIFIIGSLFFDFVKNVCFCKVVELLKEGGFIIVEIVDKVGFNIFSYFIKLFKKLFGVLFI